MITEREIRMPFGKHKGTPVKDLPAHYLSWLSTIELRDPLLYAVRASAGYVLDGVVIRSTTALRRRVEPSAGPIIGRKIFGRKRNLLEEYQGRP